MAIPIGILVVAAVIVVAAFFNPFRLIAAFPIDPGKVSLSGTKIVMELPRLNGFTSDSRPYELTARAAAQDITKPDILELKDIDARVEMKDGQHVTIKSNNGIYDTKSEMLKLNDRIVLTSTNGYEGHLSEATVNVATGLATVEPEMQDVLLSLGATKTDLLLKVGLPRAMLTSQASGRIAASWAAPMMCSVLGVRARPRNTTRGSASASWK